MAQKIGYYPEIILAGRRVNDRMGGYMVGRLVKLMNMKKIHVVDSNILILGVTFKENCPDIRNTRVIDIYKELITYNANVDIYDPWAEPEEVEEEYGIHLTPTLEQGKYDAIILAVGHDEFRNMSPAQIKQLGKNNSVIFDVKHALPKDIVDARL
jgi:UDP-N-acetyl-D-galactosamine dehydrogenase